METLDEQFGESTDQPKQRHGCVTTWLIIMIVANSVITLLYLLAGDTISRNLPNKISQANLTLLAILGICNVVFSIMLFRWKKFGFWGFIATSIAASVINLSIGLGIGQALSGWIGIAILYGILQIKKDNVAAWDNLE